MMDYFDEIHVRLEKYKKVHKKHPRAAIIKMLLWNGAFLLKVPKPDKAQKKNDDEQKTKQIVLNPKKVNVGFLIRGGMGDYLVQANYIYKFRQKYQDDLLNIDVFTRRSYNTAKLIFDSAQYPVIDGLYEEEGNKDSFRNYDLFIDLSRYPDVKRRQLGRIAEAMPELLDYVFLMEKFRAENEKFYKYAGSSDGQSAMLCILEGRKRINQPDIYGYFGMTEEYELPLETKNDEEYLKEVGIGDRPFITIHRGCDTNYTKDSVKLWPMPYYRILVRLLKEKYPDLLVVQIGVSVDRCPEIEGADINLVGKTNLEQVMVLLKHATVHIDGEGGMVHLRHALKGGKSVVVFGPTSAEFFGYSENENIVGEGCNTWCEWTFRNWQERCMRDKDKAPCMYSVVPEMVLERVGKVLEEV